MLRRTKDELQERKLLEMPTKTIELVDVELDRDEMNVYQKVLLFYYFKIKKLFNFFFVFFRS